MFKKTGIRHGQVISALVAGCIADVIEKKAHDVPTQRERGEKKTMKFSAMISIIPYLRIV
jgi:hypothetical protein